MDCYALKTGETEKIEPSDVKSVAIELLLTIRPQQWWAEIRRQAKVHSLWMGTS